MIFNPLTPILCNAQGFANTNKRVYLCSQNGVAMRKLIKVAIACVTVCMIVACHHNAEQKIRLADELVYTNPDSSLALLRQIDTSSLHSASSRAYYALMWTQSAYRANQFDLVSDSLVQAAYDYYSRHGNNREKLVRSMIYLGFNHETNNDSESAMLWYKTAESIADTTDYRNLGQINLRIGEAIGKHNHFLNNAELHRYEKALYYYNKVCDTLQIIYCLLGTGALYRNYGIDSAKHNLLKAYQLSKAINNKKLCARSLEFLSRGYLKDTLCELSKEVALHCINKYPNEERTIDAHYDAACAYALLGNNDSAMYYLNAASQQESDKNDVERSALRMFCMKIIAENQGDFLKSVQINEQREHLNDSLRESQVLHHILDIDYQESHKMTDSLLYEQKMKRGILFIVLVLIILAASFIIYLMKRHEQERVSMLMRHVEELANERESLQDSNDRIQQKGMTFNKRLTELLSAYHGLCGRIIDMSTSMPEKAFLKKFKEEISSFTQREEFLKELQKYIDEHNDNALEKLFKQHPNLSTKDRGLIILTAWQMRSANIAVCLDIPSENTIRGMRKRLSDKLSLPVPLADYLKEIIKNSPSL